METKKTRFHQTTSKHIVCISFALLSPVMSLAATGKTAPAQGYYSPTFALLVGIALFLLAAILVMMSAVAAATKWKTEKESKGKSATTIKTLLLLIGTTAFSTQAFSQTDSVATPVTKSFFGGLDAMPFFAMIAIIAFELFVLNMLRNLLMQLLDAKEYKKALAAQKVKVKQPSLIEKLNASVAIEEEADIMLDHEYDGIRELDNNLPPWWKYGFYVTIIWSGIYLVYYHVTKTGKLQAEEYNTEMKVAKAELEEYRKKAANLVDENNATTLTDEASLSEGKNIYSGNCATCHGKLGEGGVGPNLTDDYWLHGGDVKDIFATIKYGYPEKGMKSWQQDLGARQIHMVSSYIKSICGTNPPNGKAKQGDLYKEIEPAKDTLKTK
ncbi:MAG TPA: cbb3-type cytochrome c oxidase N-terminal domain-containing protein [Flavobacteriales bacterium]|nr:cbb3-type cytochrome c oxidase N-terminal domain-containing protein [Flavobacteriales bacterium]